MFKMEPSRDQNRFRRLSRFIFAIFSGGRRMATLTDICNAALSHCGTRSKVSSLDEPSPEAIACTTHFAMARDATLRAFDWNFARLTVALADLGSPPQPNVNSAMRWAYRYALPADCVRLRRLNDTPVLKYPETFFEMAADTDPTGAVISVILTDVSPVSAIYTAVVTDPLRWDQGFVDAMAYALAGRICFELTGKEDRATALIRLWQMTIAGGAAEAANEGGSAARNALPDSLTVRGYHDPMGTV
jgi:hypothetical protein